MDIDASLYEEHLTFYIVSTRGEPSEDLSFAREKISEHVPRSKIVDISARDCEDLIQTVSKKTVFVFDLFEGEHFEKIAKTDALVVSPRCVISCFMHGGSIPSNKSPVYTLAMFGLRICLSTMSKNEKEEFRRLIEMMGGRYMDEITAKTTHLVTNNVTGLKYEQAMLKKIKVMKTDWIRDVWQQSCVDHILATNETFDKHALPIFNGLVLCATGLDSKRLREVRKSVEENGGVLQGNFSTAVEILIVPHEPKMTPKIQAAISLRKDIVMDEWIFECIKHGYSVPFEKYRVQLEAKRGASTPERTLRENVTMNMTNEVSCVSIGSVVNETQFSITPSSLSAANTKQKKTDVALAVEKLDVIAAKRAGPFLDGCYIFVCGFTDSEKEKIIKILNSGGATRYDTVNLKLSHILIGNPTKKDIALLQAAEHNAVLVNVHWLIESIVKEQAIVNCDRFLYHLSGRDRAKDAIDESANAPSPASKRNILSMSGNSSKQEKRRRLDFQAEYEKSQTALPAAISSSAQEQSKFKHNDDFESSMVDQYANASVHQNQPEFKVPAPLVAVEKAMPTLGTKTSTPKDQNEIANQSKISSNHGDLSHSTESGSLQCTEYNFLAGKTIFTYGFDAESLDSINEDCKLCGAVVVDETYDEVDYLIVALDILSLEDIPVRARNIVNQNWLISSKDENTLLEIAYFYEPIIFPEDKKPLIGKKIVFSLYSGDERAFLNELAIILGADVRDALKRAEKPLLICKLPKEMKYSGAIKWNLGIVTCEWLLECYRQQKAVSMKKFLLGDSIRPADDVSDDENDANESSIICASPAVTDGIVIKTRATLVVNNRLNQLKTGTRGAKQKDNADLSSDEFNTSIKTPEPKRRCDDDERDTPEYFRDEYFQEYRRKILQEQRDEYALTESDKKQKQSTPWTVYKRRFWKEALGDEYCSPSTYKPTQISQPTVHRTLTYEDEEENPEADMHIQRLHDFIQNRVEKPQPSTSDDRLPDTAPPMTEMDDFPSSERYGVVGWRDPDEVNERRDSSAKKQPRNEMKYKGTPCFMVSVSNEHDKSRISRNIRELNGRVSLHQKFDKNSTHVLCERPSRSERVMCSILSGKWILSIDYIEKSLEAGYFLNEESFEWGNPKATHLTLSDENEKSIANAAHRLRCHLQNGGESTFSKMRAIIRTGKDENIRNFIEAGQGKVIELDKNKSLSEQKELLSSATIIVVNPKIKFSDADIQAIKDSNVPCVDIYYLNACVVEINPSMSTYLVKL